MPQSLLDNINEIKKLDARRMLASIEHIAGQLSEVHPETKAVKLPASYKQIKNIAVFGMGGSALGAHIISSVYYNKIKVPFNFFNDYHIPDSVNKDTLFFGISYSGTTEEILNAVKEARGRGAKIVLMTSSGKMVDWAKENNIPILVFSTKSSPSNQPRMGLGYMLFGPLLLLAKLKLIKFGKIELLAIKNELARWQNDFGVKNFVNKNAAKQIAQKAIGRSVWFVSAEHLAGNAHAAANQMNENGKRFAGYYFLPELNHHLMEGMRFPGSNPDNLLFVLIGSKLYDERIQRRVEITGRVLDKNKIKYSYYECSAKTKLGQVCEALILSSYISFYAAILEKIDPTPIPYVDYFKAELKK